MCFSLVHRKTQPQATTPVCEAQAESQICQIKTSEILTDNNVPNDLLLQTVCHQPRLTSPLLRGGVHARMLHLGP